MRPAIKYIVALIYGALLSLSTLAQDLDSLVSVLQSVEEDSVRMRLQFEMCDIVLFSDQAMASEYCGKAEVSARLQKDTLRMAKAANYAGILATVQSHYLTGIENFQEAMRLYESQGDLEGQAKLTNNIGVIYSMLENYREAIRYYKDCYALNLQIGDYEGAAFNLYNMAGDHLVLEEYENSRFYIDSLISLQSVHGNYLSPSTLLGEWYLSNEQLDSAQHHLFISLEEHERKGETHHVVSDHLSLANLFLQKGYLSTSSNYLDQAEASASENNLNTELILALELRAELLEKQGEFEKALDIQKEFIALNDSLDNINNFNRISELNARFESDQKEKELAEKEVMLRQQHTEKRNQRTRFLLIIAFVAVISVLLGVGFMRKRKTNLLLNNQNAEIREQRKKIISSINYAQKIQSAILLPESEIQKHLPNSFIYFRPKDIVSGDFYWFERINGKIFMAAIDCTGHGVPGAFMSLIAHSKLNRVVKELGIHDPSEILNRVHVEIMESLNQNGNSHKSQDGMDMSFCVLDTTNQVLEYAGARNPILLLQEETIKEIKPDKLSIGGSFFDTKHSGSNGFKTQRIPYKTGDCLFLFTDGYIDQFGGDEGKKLNKKRFNALLQSLCEERDFEACKAKLDNYLKNWRGDNEQIDDILIIGTKL